MKKLISIILIFILLAAGCTKVVQPEAVETNIKEKTESAETFTPSHAPTVEKTPTPTLEPTQTPVPTVEQYDIYFDDISEPEQVDIVARTRFNFGGESVNWSGQIVSTQDDEGNIYFTRDGDVQKIDVTTEETSVEYMMDEILNIYDEETLN